MAFTAITKPTVGEATKKTAFADAVIDNLSDLNGRSSSGGSSIPNAGFDTDTDADGTPDSWTVTDTGGSHTIEDDDNTEQARGTSAFQFAYPASSSGGGYIETTDQIDVAHQPRGQSTSSAFIGSLGMAPPAPLHQSMLTPAPLIQPRGRSFTQRQSHRLTPNFLK